MSRIGKLPILIPKDVNVEINGLSVNASGPKGKLSKTFKGDINISISDDKIIINPLNKTKNAKSMWGTSRSVISSMIKGVKEGFSQDLEVNGVGYRASIKGDHISMSLGKSHGTKIRIPEGIGAETPKQNIIVISSADLEKLGQFASIIKRQRPHEPYKGKGIITKGQFVQRKEGKKN